MSLFVITHSISLSLIAKSESDLILGLQHGLNLDFSFRKKLMISIHLGSASCNDLICSGGMFSQVRLVENDDVPGNDDMLGLVARE